MGVFIGRMSRVKTRVGGRQWCVMSDGLQCSSIYPDVDSAAELTSRDSAASYTSTQPETCDRDNLSVGIFKPPSPRNIRWPLLSVHVADRTTESHHSKVFVITTSLMKSAVFINFRRLCRLISEVKLRRTATGRRAEFITAEEGVLRLTPYRRRCPERQWNPVFITPPCFARPSERYISELIFSRVRVRSKSREIPPILLVRRRRRPRVIDSSICRMDGQTDRQTDRRTRVLKRHVLCVSSFTRRRRSSGM